MTCGYNCIKKRILYVRHLTLTASKLHVAERGLRWNQYESGQNIYKKYITEGETDLKVDEINMQIYPHKSASQKFDH